MPRRRVATLLLAFLSCSDAPPPVVTDAVHALSAEQHRDLDRQHALLLRDHDIDYRVDVTDHAGELLGYGVRRFQELDVGSRSRSGRGLLLVIDPARDRLRLEVGQSLEGVFPDAFIAYLEERQMAPFFRAGRIADGILAATELVVTRAQQADLGEAFAGPARTGSAGGGAAARVAFGAGPDPRFRSGPDVAAHEAPEQTVKAYLEAMRARNGNPVLDLYSAETRELMRSWVVTPGQMDAIAHAYRGCRAQPARLDAANGRAVVRYPVEARHCAPWFLVREDGRWRLDLVTAQQVLRFGAGNAWHFAGGALHPYAFAFGDWDLDRHGFPRVASGEVPAPEPER